MAGDHFVEGAVLLDHVAVVAVLEGHEVRHARRLRPAQALAELLAAERDPDHRRSRRLRDPDGGGAPAAADLKDALARLRVQLQRGDGGGGLR